MFFPDYSFRKASWGDKQVRFSTILDNLPERHQRRKTQWLNAALKGVWGAPKEVQSCCSFFLFDGQYDTNNQWINVYDALALLTCGPDSWLNEELICEIELRSGLKLPKKSTESRHEAIFGKRLYQTLKAMEKPTGMSYSVKTQVYFNEGKYRVDFFVTSAKKLLDGSLQEKGYVIEFDEKFHNEPNHKKADLKRDRWFKSNRKDLKLIRVRHQEMDQWLACLAGLQALRTLDEYKAYCIKAASEIRSERRVITSESAKAAYKQENNGCSCLLFNEKRPFVELSGLLDELGVDYSKTDRITIARGGKYKM